MQSKIIDSGLYYLACPYTHKEHYMLVARHLLVNKFAAKLMAEGKYIFSPISHTHPIAEAGANGTPLPRGWEYWEGYDRRILSCCDGIIVLRLPGWETSTGVQAEIKIAREMGIPIKYVDYDLLPSIEETTEIARQMEINQISSHSKSTSSTYDSTGICLGSTDVCSLRYVDVP